MKHFLTMVLLIGVAASGMTFGAYSLGPHSPLWAPEEKPVISLHEAGRIVREMRNLPGLLHQNVGKAPGKPGAQGVGGYTGDDSCQWANDGECDDPGLGTGACTQGTDYSDCRRLATNSEDDSCQWASDGECDEPHFGTGACTQGTDRSDCGEVSHLRFQTDTCTTAFDGTCDEPEIGTGSCETRTDRADCIGRERPMQISDHYFGRDDRVFMDTSHLPWSVVGTLTDDDGGSCTAALIGEDILITAAHCIEYESGPDATGTFEAAFARAGGPLSARVTDFFLSPDRAAEQQSSDEPSNTDWALLRIDQPLGRELGFLGVRPLRNGRPESAIGTRLYQAGYSWDTGDHLSGNLDCEVLDVEDENKLAHNCDTTSGDSGSPFLVRDGDEYFVVGVDSTYRIQPNVSAINIATGSNGWLPFLDDFVSGAIGNGSARPQPPAGKNPKG